MFDNIHHHHIVKDILYRCKKQNIIPNLLLIGDNNIGKKFLIQQFLDDYFQNNSFLLKTQILRLNIVIDKSIKKIREIIKKFINEISYFDDDNIILKFIIIDNIEYITFEIQYALRRIIEDNNKKIRFILIGTNSQTIIQPLISRCLLIYFNNLNFKQKQIISNSQNVHKLYSLSFLQNNPDFNFHISIDWNTLLNKSNHDLYFHIKKLCYQNNNFYLIIDNFMNWIIINDNLCFYKKFKLFKHITFKFSKIFNKANIFLNIYSIFIYYITLIKN